MKLTFCGGVKSVTGANYLLENKSTKFLVECGLYQGEKFCEKENYNPFPYDPKEIKAIFITHAHLDHIGRLPQLVRQGFRGKIYSTPPTKDLALFILLDAAHLFLEQTEEPPLYFKEDVLKTMELWETIDYHQPLKMQGVSFEFISAGHILGSASLIVSWEDKRLIFSGDLGNIFSPFIVPKEFPSFANYVVLESTYGDRKHQNVKNRQEVLLKYIQDVVENKSVLLIPAFALERTQELIFDLNYLVEHILKTNIRVFVDSPLAFQILEVYKKYVFNSLYFKEEVINIQKNGDDIFNFKGLRIIKSLEESREIFEVRPPKIIISAAGMSNGGRVLLHEIEYLSNPQNILLIVGYQTPNSLGGRLLKGEKLVEILGQEIKVRAKINFFDGYSAHADQEELIHWLSEIKGTQKVFVVQGEPQSSLSLEEKIQSQLQLPAVLPSLNESVIL